MKSIPCSLGEQDTRDDVYRQMTQDSSSGGVSDNLQQVIPVVLIMDYKKLSLSFEPEKLHSCRSKTDKVIFLFFR